MVVDETPPAPRCLCSQDGNGGGAQWLYPPQLPILVPRQAFWGQNPCPCLAEAGRDDPPGPRFAPCLAPMQPGSRLGCQAGEGAQLEGGAGTPWGGQAPVPGAPGAPDHRRSGVPPGSPGDCPHRCLSAPRWSPKIPPEPLSILPWPGGCRCPARPVPAGLVPAVPPLWPAQEVFCSRSSAVQEVLGVTSSAPQPASPASPAGLAGRSRRRRIRPCQGSPLPSQVGTSPLAPRWVRGGVGRMAAERGWWEFCTGSERCPCCEARVSPPFARSSVSCPCLRFRGPVDRTGGAERGELLPVRGCGAGGRRLRWRGTARWEKGGLRGRSPAALASPKREEMLSRHFPHAIVEGGRGCSGVGGGVGSCLGSPGGSWAGEHLAAGFCRC